MPSCDAGDPFPELRRIRHGDALRDVVLIQTLAPVAFMKASFSLIQLTPCGESKLKDGAHFRIWEVA